MKAGKWIIGLGLVAAFCAGSGRAQNGNIELVAVSYDGLAQEVLRQRGKVVVVDFWASFCMPCKKAFPHLIEMHKKYAAHGLVVISVSVDDANDKEKVAAAHTFLRQIDSPFRNLLLRDPPDSWMKKLEFSLLPCCYVFDRHGKWTRFGGVESAKSVSHDDLEKLVVRLLGEKR
jgi:thiol-disulfide isomerase/thioredoxin